MSDLLRVAGLLPEEELEEDALGALVAAAREAQLAGVTLTLRDWAGLTRPERIAWLAARQLLAAAAAGPAVTGSAENEDAARVRRALEWGAAEVLRRRRSS